MSNEPPLPEESRAQEIGQKAVRAFYANHPDTWRLTSLEGTTDFGLDYQVQILQEHKVRYTFRLQLKGTESPDLNASGDFFSVPLKTSTINFYDRITEPIILVLCDLSKNPTDPASCPLYYVWAKDEIERFKGEDKDTSLSPDTRTIRFPKANLLTRNLDISSVLEDSLRLHQVATAFDRAVASMLPETGPDERAQILGDLSGQISHRGRGFVEALSAPAATPWPEAPKDSVAGQLNEVHHKLRASMASAGKLLLNEIEHNLDKAAPMERAEFWYLIGRIRSLESDNQGAADAYARARGEESSVTKYLIAWAEAELRLRCVPGKVGTLTDLIGQLTSDETEVVALAARVLAASERYDEAFEKLSGIPRKDALETMAIIATMKGDSEHVVQLCNEGLQDSIISDNRRQLFLLLRARAYFNQALKIQPGTELHHVFPLGGPADIDLKDLSRAWDDIQVTVDLMRVAGWPTNIEFLSDIWAATAIMLGRYEEILPDIQEAARTRPALVGLQFNYEQIAVQCGKFDLALEALNREPVSKETTFRKIACLNQAGRHADCVALIQAELSNLPRDHEMFPVCISLGLLSADQIINVDVARDLDNLLRSNPKWSEHLAVVNYFQTVSQNALARDEAVRKLEDAYKRSTKSDFIGIHFFHALDPTNENQARKCIEVAHELRQAHQLIFEDILYLAQAYTSIGDWTALLALVDESSQRFGHVGRLAAIRAFALDKLGRTPEAVDELKALMERDTSDPIAVNIYINIVTRCGFTDEAIKLVENILGKEFDKAKKRDYLRLLFSLVQQSNPQSPRLEGIAWRIGQISDQSNETEEGLFLIGYLSATLSASVAVNEQRKVEFQRRLAAFTQKWPKSKILRGATLPENPTLSDLERLVDDVFGDTRDRRTWQAKMTAQLARGEIPIPFAWRPRNILLNVSDVPALWEIAKNSKKDAHQYHLTMVLNEWKSADPRTIRGHIPLIDLITLFVIKDLDLFNTLFSFFPQIAISQGTFLELQHLAQPMAGSWARQQCLDVVSVLKAHFVQIIQPSIAKSQTNELQFSGRQSAEEVKRLVSERRFMLYSDDVLFRIYAEAPEDGPPTICTLDLLNAAESRGLLSAEDAARRIGLLCKWNVVIVITQRLLFASIPDSVGRATSVEAALEALQRDELASAIFEGIWNVRKPYEYLLAHIGEFVAALVGEPDNRLETIAAIWGLWYLKAKLRSDVGIDQPLRHLALSMIKAAQGLDAKDTDGIRKLWNVFRSLVPLEFGDHMDEQREKDAIKLVGAVVAEVDVAAASRASLEPLEPKLILGLTEGTAEYDWFSHAYSSRRIELLKKAKR